MVDEDGDLAPYLDGILETDIRPWVPDQLKSSVDKVNDINERSTELMLVGICVIALIVVLLM